MSETKTAVATNAAPKALGPYSQGILAQGLLFCSGQLPADPASGALGEGIAAQTRLALQNVEAVLRAGGASLADVVKTTVFLKNMDDFAAMNAVYAEMFPGVPPARSTIEVARLPRDAMIEIEAIAVRPER
jgi:2-iminobutanoate/2-iminopropanoate deaminase